MTGEEQIKIRARAGLFNERVKELIELSTKRSLTEDEVNEMLTAIKKRDQLLSLAKAAALEDLKNGYEVQKAYLE